MCIIYVYCLSWYDWYAVKLHEFYMLLNPADLGYGFFVVVAMYKDSF